jgi:hypothetical protein
MLLVILVWVVRVSAEAAGCPSRRLRSSGGRIVASRVEQGGEAGALLAGQRREGVDQLADVPLGGGGLERAPLVGALLGLVGVVAPQGGGAGAKASTFGCERHDGTSARRLVRQTRFSHSGALALPPPLAVSAHSHSDAAHVGACGSRADGLGAA